MHAGISYFIGEKDRWGKGYATEAIGLVTRFAFETCKLHYIMAGIYASNISSIKALQKSGFVEQGRLIGQLIGADGWEDHVLMGCWRFDKQT